MPVWKLAKQTLGNNPIKQNLGAIKACPLRQARFLQWGLFENEWLLKGMPMDNFKAIYRILRYLEKAMDYDEPDVERISADAVGMSNQRWMSIMEMLIQEKYIDGVSVKRSVDGSTEISLPCPRITLKGLEYLQENSLMQKIANLSKGIVEIVK